jgi:peroxiredoxin
MKKILILLFGAFLMASCSSKPAGETTVQTIDPETEGKIIVYYFHGKQRCVTCTTLEEVVRNTVADLRTDHSEIVFVEIDFSERENAALAEKYEIVFSSLVIARDDKFVDITDEAFALVMRNPDVLKQRITEETLKLAAL